jgi:hypothetical protein
MTDAESGPIEPDAIYDEDDHLEEEENDVTRSFAHVLATICDGTANSLASEQLKKLMRKLTEESNAIRGPAKGTLTLKLNFTLDGDHVQIGHDTTIKEPKRRTKRGVMYVDDDGHLSFTHPRQLEMTLREVTPKKRARREVVRKGTRK